MASDLAMHAEPDGRRSEGLALCAMGLRVRICRVLDTSLGITAATLRSPTECVRTQRLELAAAPDLLCANIMCEKLGGPCLCRVSVALQKLPRLTHIDLSSNNLPAVPDAVSPQYLPSLSSLDVSRNAISELPASLTSFSTLRVRAILDALQPEISSA